MKIVSIILQNSIIPRKHSFYSASLCLPRFAPVTSSNLLFCASDQSYLQLEHVSIFDTPCLSSPIYASILLLKHLFIHLINSPCELGALREDF